MVETGQPGSHPPLGPYRARRDFAGTPEPAGEPAPVPGDEPGGRFVVQRHRARRLHYDLRLEVGGVLVSWAVPKGPTLDPDVRRMAVHVEDHPIEYLDFEGVIPGGQYGGGDVVVWDRGVWRPVGSGAPVDAIAAGELHFDLRGEKLSGRFVLVRTGGGRSSRGRPGREHWLLLHKHDDAAVPGWDPEAFPESVKSGRANDAVRAEPEASVGTGWDGPSAAELAALDALGAKGTWSFQGRELALTNLDKVLVPARREDERGDGPITKRELIRYYAGIAPVMLPFLTRRPVNLHRFPDGIGRPGFWQKEVPSHAPDWLHRWRYPEAGPHDVQWYAVLDEPAAVVWMANSGAIELHPWTSRLPDVQRPTWAFVDIDPGIETAFEDVVDLARLYHTALEHLDVVGLPKVTGQRGIQIWIPVTEAGSFEETRTWVETVSRAVGATVPGLVSWAWTKEDRRGRARLDYTQNMINKTLVAPYSVRPAPGGPVSVPIAWDELDDPQLRPDRWTIRTVVERVTATGDPFAALLRVEQRLPAL